MNLEEFRNRYQLFFDAAAQRCAINPTSLANIAFCISGNQKQLLRTNNFFGVQRNGRYRTFTTPFEGIASGVEIILANPDFAKMKIGTLKANPKIQTERLKILLNIV